MVHVAPLTGRVSFSRESMRNLESRTQKRSSRSNGLFHGHSDNENQPTYKLQTAVCVVVAGTTTCFPPFASHTTMLITRIASRTFVWQKNAFQGCDKPAPSADQEERRRLLFVINFQNVRQQLRLLPRVCYFIIKAPSLTRSNANLGERRK